MEIVCGTTWRVDSRCSRSHTSSVEAGRVLEVLDLDEPHLPAYAAGVVAALELGELAGAPSASVGGPPSAGDGNHTSSTVPSVSMVARP